MNCLCVIIPYRHAGGWAFDDEDKGLNKEPLVLGIDRILDIIAGEHNSVRLIFSDQDFPGRNICLHWTAEEKGGNWYYCVEYDIEGWLCPALFRYFKEAPKTIFICAD